MPRSALLRPRIVTSLFAASISTRWPELSANSASIVPPSAPSETTITPSEAEAKARSEEHTSELQSLMRISYAVFCLKKKNKQRSKVNTTRHIQVKQKHMKNNKKNDQNNED